ncbi:hypothetical protein AB1Y20_017159 [Prymnesium parvum]|uniref:Uncharacterized protein n=1 Tax=Prymnesium parvum TaxID=97485 RepID=A0AB34IAQ0_PRYPA
MYESITSSTKLNKNLPAPSRESLQAAAAAAAAASLAASKPPPNRRSAALAARRFDAGAPAGGNYGEALYREAAALAARREAWAEGERCRQAEEEGRQCTFAPRLEQRERKAALAELVREEAAREYTFKPHVAVTKNKLSEQLTAGYGNVLDEMSKRDEARERRQQELKSKLEEDARKNLTHKPTLHRPHSASSPSPSAAEPAYERLYMQRTASHAADDSPSAIDPECTFHPNKSAAAEAWGEGAVVRSRAHLEEVGEALYKDAHNRRLRRQMMAEQMAAELNELRNIPKMSKRSNELALQKLRKDVLDIYSLLNAEQTGISYQELGAALVELGLLRWIGPPPDTNASSAAREDTLMLQRVWRALTRAEGREAAEARLPSAVLIDFMMAALSPERQAEEREEPKAREECATPSPRREEGEEEEGGGGSGGGGSGEGGGGGGEEDGGEGEEADGAGEGGGGRREAAGEGAAPPKPWGDDASLLSDFAALYRNTLSYKSTRNVREATEVELARSQAECTFNPAIDARSRRLEAFRQAAEAPRHERLYETARQIEARLEEMRRRHEAAALEGCSFRPAVNKPPLYIRANLQQSSGEMGQARFDHLHAEAAETRHKKESLSVTSTEREVAECTFKPVTNTNYAPPRVLHKPTGYEQAVGRLRKVSEETKEREAKELEAARKREEMRLKRVPPKPFSFQTERRASVERKQPLLYMDVNLGPGRTGRIGLHEGDNPAELAANFARTYQLDSEMQGRLQKLIVKYMNDVLPDLASQSSGVEEATPATGRQGRQSKGSKGSPSSRSPPSPANPLTKTTAKNVAAMAKRLRLEESPGAEAAAEDEGKKEAAVEAAAEEKDVVAAAEASTEKETEAAVEAAAEKEGAVEA